MISSNAPPKKQKNQPGNAAPNTGMAGDKEQPETAKRSNNNAGRARFTICFKGRYLNVHAIEQLSLFVFDQINPHTPPKL